MNKNQNKKIKKRKWIKNIMMKKQQKITINKYKKELKNNKINENENN
jgi:hypothetical protein